MSVGVVGTPSPAPSREPYRLARGLVAGRSTPARLRRAGAVLILGCLLFALVSLLSGESRSDAVRDAGSRISALNGDAAELYRSLADADAMATSGYVAGGREPAPVRARYDEDIQRASRRLVQAAGRLPEGDPAQAPIATISAQLPIYTGLVETARAHNRQGLPLGQSYLDSGSRLMRETMLPAAQELRRLQADALDADYRRGGGLPLAVVAIGIAALVAVVDVGWQERRRTNRVLSPGLLVAGLALAAALTWWAAALLLAGSHLDQAKRHSAAAAALDDARAAVLLARSNESLVLVARSGGAASDTGFTAEIERVLGPAGRGGLLAATTDAVDPVLVGEIREAVASWDEAHRRLRELDDGGDYRAAVASATGADPAGSGAAFGRVDGALGAGADGQRQLFDAELDAAGGALTALSAGPAVLGVVAAAAAATGIGRRIGEYR
ncbi:MAG TPA: hypothetical protein VNO83_09240 [Pseudonocardia sp.]|nr:hypothetical protein [Pseudonocardia sp.]